jgi:hypothetical protein
MMTVVTEDRIDGVLREALAEHGILGEVKDIDVFVSPDGVLAEVSLHNASALERARQAVDSAARQLEGEGIWLLPTIRGLWDVEDVQKVEVSGPPGAPSDLVGALFTAALRSGTRRQEVWVAVTPSAQRALRPVVNSDSDWLGLIRAFLGHRLSVRGGGHWDPIHEPKVEINEAEARYLRWRPFEQLKGALARNLGSSLGNGEERKERLRRFLGGLAVQDIKSGDFDAVVLQLTVGGAIALGERAASSRDLYQMLLDSEKRELRNYYEEQIELAKSDFPDLTF